jgi:hypothetical protein
MQESYSKVLTKHTGLESCARVSNNLCEALTEVHAGWPLSREIPFQGADTLKEVGRQYWANRVGEICSDPARSKNPRMHGTNLRENREILCLSFIRVTKGTCGNSEEVIS